MSFQVEIEAENGGVLMFMVQSNNMNVRIGAYSQSSSSELFSESAILSVEQLDTLITTLQAAKQILDVAKWNKNNEPKP